MKRPLAIALAVIVAALAVAAFVHRAAQATLDDDVFTSREADVRMLAPRGWRVSDAPTYPGVLLWMNRATPKGQMLLTVEDISATSRACWPAECGHTATVPDFVCVLVSRLRGAGFTVGPIEDGRWFDYQQGKSATAYLRQGVVVFGHHAFTLILSASSSNDRATHARAFDRALRSVRPLSAGGASDEVGSAGDRAPGSDDGDTTSTTSTTSSTGGPDGDAATTAPVPVATSDATLLDGDVVAHVIPGDGGAAPTLVPLDARPASADAGVQVIESVPPCKLALDARPAAAQ